MKRRHYGPTYGEAVLRAQLRRMSIPEAYTAYLKRVERRQRKRVHRERQRRYNFFNRAGATILRDYLKGFGLL